jgi:hypothetical protein
MNMGLCAILCINLIHFHGFHFKGSIFIELLNQFKWKVNLAKWRMLLALKMKT